MPVSTGHKVCLDRREPPAIGTWNRTCTDEGRRLEGKKGGRHSVIRNVVSRWDGSAIQITNSAMRGMDTARSFRRQVIHVQSASPAPRIHQDIFVGSIPGDTHNPSPRLARERTEARERREAGSHSTTRSPTLALGWKGGTAVNVDPFILYRGGKAAIEPSLVAPALPHRTHRQENDQGSGDLHMFVRTRRFDHDGTTSGAPGQRRGFRETGRS